MADDQLSEIWKAAIEQYEADTENDLKAASESPKFANISSVDELLTAIDDKQKAFGQYRKRGAKIKGALEPVLDVVGMLADAAGEGVAVVFPPGKAVFVVVKLLVDVHFAFLPLRHLANSEAMPQATHDVKSRYDAIIDIFERMESFLRRCRIYIKPGINISDVLRMQIVKILAHLLFIMGKVTKYIRKGCRGQIKHPVLGFLKKNTMQEALTKLDHLTKEEGLAVLAATLDGVRDVDEDVRDVNEGVKQVNEGVNGIGRKLDSAQEDAELHKCYSWLSAPDPWINHNGAQEKLHDQSTGKWIFQDQRFVEWLDKTHSLMWLHGKPGGGKSVLCSTVIKMLQDHVNSTMSCALAFFYFDFKDLSKQNFSGFLRSIPRQLSSQSLGASAVLKKLYVDHDNGLRQPSQKDLQIALGNILKHFDAAYIVLDALDECHVDDRDRHLISFVTMLNAQNSVHFLATSRNEADIKECLETNVTHVVNLGDTLIYKDIEAYLSAVLQQERHFRKCSDDIKQEIKNVLLKKANGMFLWVECQLKELKKRCGTPGLREALHNLPSTLEETYARILTALDKNHTSLAEILLEKGADVNAQACYNRTALRAASSKGYTYLVEILLEKGADINAQSDNYGNALVAASKRGHTPLAKVLLEKGADVNAHVGSSETALIAASSEGQISMVEILLEKGANINAQASNYGTALIAASLGAGHYGSALIAASLGGHTSLAEILLEKGADIHAQVGKYEVSCPATSYQDHNALTAASDQGHTSLVEMLLKWGADVNAQASSNGNALIVASHAGHTSLIEILLKKGADINAQGGYFRTALIAASSSGHTSLVQFLLEKGADVNAQAGPYHNAFQTALSQGHASVAEILLERDVDLNASPDCYETALITAASRGYTSVVKAMLDKSTNINAQHDGKAAALIVAIEEGHTSVAEILLERDTDVNEQGCHSETALIAAASRGYTSLAKILLERGANANAQATSNYYRTALIAASSNGHTSLVEILLEKGADINAQTDKWPENALVAALPEGHTSVARVLLEKGADVNTHVFSTLLISASYEGNTSIAEILLEKGANVHAQSSFYGTALIAASSRGYISLA
ncbi:hypothetical protein EVG20_g8001, partial [Dentipellis fragilis]